MNIRLLISVLLLFMIAESSIYAMNPEEESPKIESYLELLPAETMTELFKFAISDAKTLDEAVNNIYNLAKSNSNFEAYLNDPRANYELAQELINKFPKGLKRKETVKNIILAAARLGTPGAIEWLEEQDKSILNECLRLIRNLVSTSRNMKLMFINLLEAGADPNQEDVFNSILRDSLFGESDSKSAQELLRILLNNPKFSNYTMSHSPLIESIKSANPTVVQILLEAKFDPNIESGLPLLLAKIKLEETGDPREALKLTEIIKLLKQYGGA